MFAPAWRSRVGPNCVSQVQLQLVSAAVKLFLKKPQADGKPQAMIQLVLTYATQVLPPPLLFSPHSLLHTWRLLGPPPGQLCCRNKNGGGQGEEKKKKKPNKESHHGRGWGLQQVRESAANVQAAVGDYRVPRHLCCRRSKQQIERERKPKLWQGIKPAEVVRALDGSCRVQHHLHAVADPISAGKVWGEGQNQQNKNPLTSL